MKANLVVEVQNLLDEYVEEVAKATLESAKESAELTAKTLKNTSPKRKGRGGGKYANGWKVKKQALGVNTSYVVYNGKYPGLTHLLEHGHVSANQYGTFGRARAIPHIGRAADAGIQRFELGIRARLRK